MIRHEAVALWSDARGEVARDSVVASPRLVHLVIYALALVAAAAALLGIPYGPNLLAALAISALVGACEFVICDIGMPGLSGWEVAERLHERDPACPIIMYTGYGDLAGSERADQVGAVAVVAKADAEEGLLRVLRTILDPAPARRL